MTEKELFETKLSTMEDELSKYKEELKAKQKEFVKFTNEKIGTDEFYNEASGMLSRLSRIKSLVDSKQSDVDSAKKFISELS